MTIRNRLERLERREPECPDCGALTFEFRDVRPIGSPREAELGPCDVDEPEPTVCPTCARIVELIHWDYSSYPRPAGRHNGEPPKW